eukprot:jgi/Phyca11/20646/fgenesh1_pg.PHYCAscaffold_70_\
MSDTFATSSSNAPSSSSAGNASGIAPASATAPSLQGGGDGTAVSPGGSSSAPAQKPASPRGTVADTRNDDSVVAAHEVPHMVSISDVDALLNRGLLTEVGTGASAAMRPDVPANWTARVPRHDGPVFLVGVPARAADIRQGKHVSDRYGGPSCMVGYQYLSRDDVDELERIIPGFTEGDVLRPRSMATNPRDLDGALNSIAAQRELMSLLAHLPADRLAERVFKTFGFLKLMASAHRRLREQVEAQGATAMIDAVAAQSRCDELAPMDWLSSDRACHGLFREPQLVKMLVSMMYWRRLDATPWSSYVPEVYYKMADERLDRLLNLDQLAPSWEPLDAHVPYPDEDVESTVDDTTADPDFKAPPSEGSPSEDEDDGNDSDSGSEPDGHTRKRPKRSRSQSSSDTDASAPPSKKSKAYKRASSGYQRQQTTRRQVTRNPPLGSSSLHRSLSRKAYDSLTVDELQIVEVPDDSVLSWLYFGVRVQRVSVSKSSLGQTAGFPEYEVHKHASELVKRRWDSREYTALLRMKPTPWDYMFQNRKQTFYLHRRCILNSATLELIDAFVDYFWG